MKNYELHITIPDNDAKDYAEPYASVKSFLQYTGLKFSHIVLDAGVHRSQPMLSKRFQEKSDIDAKKRARELAILLYKFGTRPKRVKLETRLIIGESQDALYYETHILFKTGVFVDGYGLKSFKFLQEAFDMQSSINLIKDGYKYLILRRETQKDFERTYTNFSSVVPTGKLPTIIDEHKEAVIMDTNKDYDNGWLYASGRKRETV